MSSKWTTHPAFAVLILCASLQVMAERPFERADSAPMPRHLYDQFDHRRPTFLEASAVIGEGGKLKTDAPLRSSAERNLRDFLGQDRVNGCVVVREVYYDYINVPRRSSVLSAVNSADFIVESRVVNKSYGFLDGVPGQLLRIRTVGVPKGSIASTTDPYYIFVPVADFTVNGVHFCKTDERYPEPPAIGDEVFVFGQNNFVAGQYINTIDEKGYLRALPNGTIVVPKSLETTGAGELSLARIRRLAAEANGRTAQ